MAGVLETAADGERFSSALGFAIRAAIFVAAVGGLLAALPFTADPLLARVVLVEAAAVVAGTAWLAQALVTKRLSYRRSPLNAAFLVLAVVILAATAASSAPWASLWGSDPTGEKAATLVAFIVLSFVAAAAFRESDVRRLAAVLVAAFAVLGVLAILSMFAGALALPPWLALNSVGTPNALALVLGAGFLFSFGLTLSAVTGSGERVLVRPLTLAAAITALLLLFPLLVLGFWALWIGLAVTLFVAIALSFSRSWGDEGGTAFSMGMTAVAFLVATLALFATVKPIPFVARVFQPALEVAPSHAATLSIARQVLGEDPLLGLGPANFRAAFARFHDAGLNSTVFWQARFGHGASLLTTAPSTVGLAGTAALLAVVAAAVALIGRAIVKSRSSDPYLWALGMAAAFVLLEWFLYAANFAASLILFLTLGLIAALAQEPRDAEAKPSWWRVRRRVILIDTPALNFLASLVAVFAAAGSLVVIYSLGASYAAEVAYARAASALNRYGNADTARVFLERAIGLAPNGEAYHRGRAQVAAVGVGRIIAEAASAPAQDLAARFQDELSSGLVAARRAIALDPSAENWSTLAQLYGVVAPFVAGADRAAHDAYAEARKLDPVDPLLPLAAGRVLLAAADITSLQAGRSQGPERERLDQAYKDELARARQELEAAAGLKPDLASAQFLLAQVALRQGDVTQAISRAEAAAALAPADVGVAFQLGFLYYRRDDFARAEREFRRAVAVNDNYSNARYFLGLIYDRRGDGDGALSQFEKISALNPGNAEIERIVGNLKAGRPALAGIAPPGTSPEARREAPIGEGGRAPALR